MKKPAVSEPRRGPGQVLVILPWARFRTPGEARSHWDDALGQLVRRNSTLSALVFTSATLHPAAIQDRVCLCMPGP